MKIYLRDILCFAVLQLLIVGGLIAGFHRPAFKDPVLASTVLKHDRLAAATSPRVILVGGSNVLYGMDCPTLAERMPGYQPVNMGLVGGLRLDYMLNEVRPHAQKGDIIVLALEYRQLTRRFSGRSSAVTLMQLLAARPANVRYLGWQHWREIADHGILPHLGYMLRDAVDNLRHGEIEKHTRGLNAYGDLIDHRGKPAKKGVARHKPMPPAMTPHYREVLDEAIDRINAFGEDCAARGATVVYSFPPLPDKQFREYRSMTDAFRTRLHQRLTVPILNDPADMVFPLSWFYDTSYHLGGKGALARSHKLADAIIAHQTQTP